MFVFWVMQTVCFALYSVHGNIAAAHTFIAMICECSGTASAYEADEPRSRIAVLFYAFCECFMTRMDFVTD